MCFGARFVRLFNNSYCNILCVFCDQIFNTAYIIIISIFVTSLGGVFNFVLYILYVAALSIFRTRFFSISQLTSSGRCSRCEEDDPPPFHTSSMEGLAQTHYSGSFGKNVSLTRRLSFNLQDTPLMLMYGEDPFPKGSRFLLVLRAIATGLNVAGRTYAVRFFCSHMR